MSHSIGYTMPVDLGREKLPPPLANIAALWREGVDGPALRAGYAAFVAAVFASAHWARMGTPIARLGSAFCIVVVLSFVIGGAIRARKTWRDARAIVGRTVVATDRDLGHRMLRALALVDRTATDASSGSPELAALHLSRLLGRLAPADIESQASRVGRWWSKGALVAGLVALGAVCLGPFRVVEGLDVLASRHGEAPLAFTWLDDVALSAHPPDYLHQPDVVVDDFSFVALPRGSLLTVRGVASHQGRRLVLVDGTSEVPLVDDASGGVVARWPLAATVKLRVAARFGNVLIPSPGNIRVTAIPDEAPQVILEGAPKRVKLLEEPEIAIRYEAQDDHGLREVDLVLRSGIREERRVLARPDGESRYDRGGYRLLASDKFFKRAFVPVEVTVEARDNDPITGPKWGKSAAITLVPPLVGEPEAMRYQAFARVRDALVDVAADRIDADISEAREEKRAHAAHEVEATTHIASMLDEALVATFGGLRVPKAAQLLARGQLRKLREAADKEKRAPSRRTHDDNRATTEDMTLAIDGALARLGVADASAVARRLADVAEDGADAAQQARRPQSRQRGLDRLDAALLVLGEASGPIRTLGVLGQDLGEIVVNDLSRINRAKQADDLVHTELAARDLAARLRHPSPSFGGGVRRGGVEAGGGSPGEEDPSDGGEEMDQEQRAIDQLSRDHAGAVSDVEQALNNASAPADQTARDEARQHARSIRDAVRPLPHTGGVPSSPEAAGAAGREHAEAMAEELERGSLGDAARSGRSALRELELAERGSSASLFDRDLQGDAKKAREKLEPEVAWAERALERQQKGASARAADDLRKSSPRESSLADRARELASKGNGGPAALPGATLDLLQGAESSMREAARALGAGDGDRALEHQRDAQRLLEGARSAEEPSDGSGDEGGSADQRGSNNGGEHGNVGDFDKHAPIPRADDYKGPEAFRRRVLEGLGAPADPRLRDAVKRYAEGLLR